MLTQVGEHGTQENKRSSGYAGKEIFSEEGLVPQFSRSIDNKLPGNKVDRKYQNIFLLAKIILRAAK